MKWSLITNSSQTLNQSFFCGSLWHGVCAASSTNPWQKNRGLCLPTTWQQRHSLKAVRGRETCEGEEVTLLLTHTLVTFTRYLHFSPAEDINTPAIASFLLAFYAEAEFLTARPKKSPTHANAKPCEQDWLMLPANKSFGLPVKRVARCPLVSQQSEELQAERRI